MGGRAGPEGRGAGEDDKVETGEKFPVPPQRGRAGPEGCGAWVFSKWKGKEKLIGSKLLLEKRYHSNIIAS